MNDVSIVMLVSLLSGMIMGGVIMGVVLMYRIINHDTHVNALKQEQRDAYNTYQKRINASSKMIGDLQAQKSEARLEINRLYELIKEANNLVESPLLDTLETESFGKVQIERERN